MLKLKAIDHVGLVVTDMDRSLRFYCEALGLELLRRSDREGGVTSAVLKVGSQEINMFCNADSTPVAKDGGASVVDHFCFEVERAPIDDVVAALSKAGIAVAKGPIKRRDGTSLFLSDPDGCRVELIVKTSLSY